ncbi:acyltransferase family protein [Paenibacillus massiliensis]|uniref:acyltransferase family protein n=1 Tax=Paenibacillus massiliensis TaxID=225917 RepID=UPI0004723385|nr:acyltransferase family protein [Paenibacillus massiliensis]
MKRQKWVDIARGILIILVVYGHSAFIQYYSNWHTYIYWFHMPAFFFLSGYVFKVKDSFLAQLKYATIRLLIPYVFIVALITIYRYLITPMSPHILTEFRNITLGGRFIDGYYAPFWFITCLWFTQITYMAIYKLPRVISWVIITLLFIISHYQPTSWRIPGNLDLSLYAILFFALGHQMKWLVNQYSCIVGSIVFLGGIYFGKQGKVPFWLDIKQHLLSGRYDLIIPLSGILMVIGISKLIERISIGNILESIGKESLIIMYLHIIVAVELYRFGIYKDLLLFVLFGISVPIMIQSLLRFMQLKTKELGPVLKVFNKKQ